jgi:predicted nucleic acid-binding Zn ribbon protein
MSDFGGFGGIVKEAQAMAENPPPIVACPRCGTPLQFNKAGIGNCPMGHYRTDGAA